MGSEVAELQKQLIDHTASLFNEGIMNEQFKQLLFLQSEGNPGFVFQVVTLFFQESDKLFNEIGPSLEQANVDFKKLDAHMHQLKGSTSSIGAQRMGNACIAFRNCIQENNFEGCLKCLEQVREEYSIVKSKLEALFKLEQQIVAAGGSIPYTFSGH
ncbi:histidine-containing phosphotransfer protein 1-like [Silene latifolia]|uniref:histidine-containing phosphotransfer protein 1-like n=1 Tax=Silene latifolia TaxID=37657 RepID=UPI003D77325A